MGRSSQSAAGAVLSPVKRERQEKRSRGEIALSTVAGRFSRRVRRRCSAARQQHARAAYTGSIDTPMRLHQIALKTRLCGNDPYLVSLLPNVHSIPQSLSDVGAYG